MLSKYTVDFKFLPRTEDNETSAT